MTEVPNGLPAVYVASFYLPELAGMVQKLLPDVKVVKIHVPQSKGKGVISAEDLRTLQCEAEILFCDSNLLTGQSFGNFKRLRWLQAKGAGVNPLMKLIDQQNPPSFPVTRLTINSRFVGEYVMMHVLARERNLLPMCQLHQQKQWKQVEMAVTRELTSLTICIIGVGAIGKEVARRCKQLGMHVHGITRSSTTSEHRSDNVDLYRTFEDLRLSLCECDYICCSLPSTKETKDFLSGDILRTCKQKKPILISVGRGDVIDEKSIVTAIRDEWIGGAILDVVPEEPLPETSPLWTLPNVLITPHIAGYTKNEHYLYSYASEFVENYHRFCKGETMKNLVDFTKGY